MSLRTESGIGMEKDFSQMSNKSLHKGIASKDAEKRRMAKTLEDPVYNGYSSHTNFRY